MAEPVLLDSRQLASFVARGFLRFDAVVPDALNRAFLEGVHDVPASEVADPRIHYRRAMTDSAIPAVAAGTPLADAYPEGSPVAAMLDLPLVRGAIESLVGAGAVFDHHFLHITYPPAVHEAAERSNLSQPYHQDSTIDPRRTFDIQLFYFPHALTAAMGGTRFLPGSHLRIVSEAAIARYQNLRGQQHVVCPAGTLLVLHHGLWHGAGLNRSERLRYLFKIRLAPGQRQRRLWNAVDQPQGPRPQRPIFWTGAAQDEGSVEAILTRPEPWFEADTSRLEYLNRIRLWRHLLGDEQFDADYWLTRVENDPQ